MPAKYQKVPVITGKKTAIVTPSFLVYGTLRSGEVNNLALQLPTYTSTKGCFRLSGFQMYKLPKGNVCIRKVDDLTKSIVVEVLEIDEQASDKDTLLVTYEINHQIDLLEASHVANTWWSAYVRKLPDSIGKLYVCDLNEKFWQKNKKNFVLIETGDVLSPEKYIDYETL